MSRIKETQICKYFIVSEVWCFLADVSLDLQRLFLFRLLLRKEGVNFRTTAEFEIVRTIKEKACYLSSNPQKEETAETEKYQYILPDGSTLDVSTKD